RPFHAELPTELDAAEATGIVAGQLRRLRYHVWQAGTEAVYADKGRWGRYGPYVTHIGLMLLLLATLGMAIPGWYHDEFFWVAEGESVRVPHTDFILRNDGFRVEFHPDGRPSLFETRAVILVNG